MFACQPHAAYDEASLVFTGGAFFISDSTVVFAVNRETSKP